MDTDLEVLYERARKSLKIDTSLISEELAQHPITLAIVGEGLAQAKSDRDTVRLEMDTAIADASQFYRKSLEGKVTEGLISERVGLDSNVAEMRIKYIEKCFIFDKWDSLYDAYRSRGYMLRDLSANALNALTAPDGLPHNYLTNIEEMSSGRRPLKYTGNKNNKEE